MSEERPDLTAVSLGAGVQSTVMLLMLDRGELGPKPDAAIFADTGWEPRGVYENLEWLRQEVRIPIHVALPARSLRQSVWDATDVRGNRHMPIPVSVRNADGSGAKIGRHCTRDYKILPIERKLRELLGVKVVRSKRVVALMGISLDEIHRCRDNKTPWIENRYPLVEADMKRHRCLEWMAREYPERELPRSACAACPYRSDREWLALKASDPAALEDAFEIDRRLRDVHAGLQRKGPMYIHRKMIPLDQAVAEAEAGVLLQPPLFGEDCSGVCGV